MSDPDNIAQDKTEGASEAGVPPVRPSDASSLPPLEVYKLVVGSYAMGLLRLNEANIAALHARIAMMTVHRPAFPTPGDDPIGQVVSELQEVTYPQYDAFTYVQEISYLVYATTLLDSFLTETTRFLFMMFPGAMGKKHSITVETILSAQSHEELLTKAASNKARELSYRTFSDRVEFLKAVFSLPLTLDGATRDALEHYANLRNVVIHDQNVFETVLGPSRTLRIRRKTCPRHPTPVMPADLKHATKAYKAVVKAVFAALVQHVLKADPATEFKGMLEVLSDSRPGGETFLVNHSQTEKPSANDRSPSIGS